MKIELTKEEALVLFEFLARNDKNENFKDLIVDQAEQRVLWNLECIFEKELVEPFKGNYIELIKEARDKIRDKE